MSLVWLAAALLGCGGDGRLELVLDLPEDPALRPEGMTTVTVVAQPFEDDPVETTSVLDGSRFEAGNLPAGETVALAVELRDGTGRLVGYGHADAPVELSDALVEERIFVRRPFLYAASPAGLFTFDPTRDPLDPDYQGKLAPTAPVRIVPIGGDELAVVRAAAVDVIATEDHQLTGTTAPTTGAATDAAPIPGTRKIVLALATGFAIVDLESGTTETVSGPAIDRVTVGVLGDGHVVVYGLVGRIAPPEVNEACPTTTSSIAAFDLATPDQVDTAALPVGLADLAAGTDAPALVGAAPCAGTVVSIDGEAYTELADLPRAALVAIQGTRVWAAGTQPAKLNVVGNTIDYVEEDATSVVVSVDIRGGGPATFGLPRRRETMIDLDDPAREHAQVMKPMAALPLDLVVLAGGEFVALANRYKYHSSALVQSGPLGDVVVLPQMDATISDVLLLDGATLTSAQRVRSQCALVAGSADIFPNWACGDADDAETPRFAAFEAVALGALFGAR